MADFKIRNVVEGDFIKISRAAENCSPMTTERTSIYHIFTKFFKKTSLVVEDSENGNIKGFLLGFISQDKSEDAYIHLFCVDESLRGKGIGSEILTEFIKIVSSMGSKRVSLISKPTNKTAIKFYNKNGFKSYKSDKTVEIDGLNLFKGYNGPGHDKILFYKYI